MPSISVPSSFFISERNSVYGDWRSAFWRELLSKSLDAGASRIRIRTRFNVGKLCIDMIDNGCGMTREILEDVYMRLGASTKDGADGIGGFGRARILTCFSQESYAIRTGNISVSGRGASYEVTETSASVRGCAISVRMSAGDAPGIIRGLQRVLRQSSLRSAIEVRIDTGFPEGVPAVMPDDAIFGPADDQGWRRFSGWTRAGRHFDTLSDEAGVWAGLHVNEGERALKHSAIIRVNGMAMYEEYIAAPVQVVVNLDPARAREILTASRDAVRQPFREDLQLLFQKISSERLSAFKGRPPEPVTQISSTQDTTGATGFVMPGRDREKNKALPEDRPAGVSLKSGMLQKGDEVSQGPSVVPGGEEGRAPGLLYPVGLHVDDPTPAQRAVVDRYSGDAWLRPGNEGRNAELLHAAWTAACRHVLRALGEKQPDLLADPDRKWISGFVFDRDMLACHMRICGVDHGLLLNPVDRAGRMRFRLSDPASLKELAATAIHEVAHVVSNRHDELFASIMTSLVGAVRDRDIEREIRIDMEKAREWQQARREVIDAAMIAAIEGHYGSDQEMPARCSA